MIGWDDKILVNATAADCFRKAVDLDNCAQWIPQVQAIERLYEGDLAVGSQWKETRKEGKRVHTMILEVFEINGPDEGEPPYVHSAGADMVNMKSFYRFIFNEADQNRCLVTLEARIEPKNFAMKLMSKLMVKYMKKSESGLLTRLKAFCEADV